MNKLKFSEGLERFAHLIGLPPIKSSKQKPTISVTRAISSQVPAVRPKPQVSAVRPVKALNTAELAAEAIKIERSRIRAIINHGIEIHQLRAAYNLAVKANLPSRVAIDCLNFLLEDAKEAASRRSFLRVVRHIETPCEID